MRLNSLLLGKFGHFIEREIRFDANAKLHIVLGPNEAGKSTLRKSWLRLLFSYDLRKGNEPEAFGFRNEDLSVSATIGYGEDQEVAVSRRWKALRDAEGAKLSDNDFLTLISSPNEQYPQNKIISSFFFCFHYHQKS